jgi:hypothetical protein
MQGKLKAVGGMPFDSMEVDKDFDKTYSHNVGF